MTACFVAQYGPLCLAAADTRISESGNDGIAAATWDANDLPIITEEGHYLLVPYRHRKIRQLSRGWAVTAGCYLTGDSMLNLLSREHISSADDATQVLRRAASAELAILETMQGVGTGDLLYESRILGVPANQDRTGVWHAQLDRATGYTVTRAAGIAMNWPSSVPTAERNEAQNAFAHALDSMTHLGDVVRAAATLISGARSAPDCSPIVQIGLTWQTSLDEFKARYLAGHVDEIMAMTNDEIFGRWETLSP